jgi:PAS domain S-box-containing protein
MEANTPFQPADASTSELRAWLAAIVDSSDDAIVSKTLDGVITSWNRGAERLFGYTATEAVGQHIFLIIPRDRREEEEGVLARLRRGERIDHFETVRQTKDGRLIDISLTVSPIADAQGRIIGASKVARDVTARLQRDELRARLAAIVDSSDDAIVSKTLDGVITSWNRGAERLFGYTAAEAVGQHIFLIIPTDRREEEEEVLARLRRGERIDHFETVRQTKDGRLIDISLTVSPIADAHGLIIGASKVARDLTERRLAAEVLRRTHDEQERVRILTRVLEGQEDERRRIARELHDQLGQQLTALRLTIETVKAYAAERTEFRVQIETLQELARQLDQDITFRVWELRPVALEDVCLQTALTKFVHNWSKHFGIPVQLHTIGSPDARLPPETEILMYRVAQEALNNIVKHARATQVDIVLERTSEHLSLIIEDDGVGFDPSDAKTARDGLGLLGMRERAALVGADVQIESRRGGGTTVIVRATASASAIESA